MIVQKLTNFRKLLYSIAFNVDFKPKYISNTYSNTLDKYI